MKEFEISQEATITTPGIYKIVFPSGHFYIGSSDNVYYRIRCHISHLKSTRSRFGGCKSLASMRDFEGKAVFTLLQPFTYINRNGCISERLKVEFSYIEAESGNPLMLNDPRATGNSTGLGVNIKKHVSDKIKSIAKEKGIKLSEYVESLFRKAIEDHESEIKKRAEALN